METCPQCSADSTRRLTLSGSDLCICDDCIIGWEPLPEGVPIDNRPFASMCDNCAFRKGSNEQSDPWQWVQVLENFENSDSKGFHCHKRIPIDLQETLDTKKVRFIYPVKDGDIDYRNLRKCRGYIDHIAKMKKLNIGE